MERKKRIYHGSGVVAEPLGARIRRMVTTHMMEPMDGEQVFDDQPNQPSKSMEVNPLYDYHNDNFDLAEQLHYSAEQVSAQADVAPTPTPSADPVPDPSPTPAPQE